MRPMRRFDTRRPRSRTEWAGRIALACGIAVLGSQSVAFSIAQVTARTQPALADRIISYDGRIIAGYANTLIGPTTTTADHARAEILARKALKRDPTTVLAVATLGFTTTARGDTDAARRLLAYAQKLSRRNLQTQLWSIEDAVAQGNVRDALHWYDITLRTKLEMGDVLYPVLTQAARDPAIRAELVRTLAGKPDWASSYIGYAAVQKDDPQSTAALFLALQGHGVAVPEPVRASVINTLLAAGDTDRAWRYYATLRPGADRRRARDPRFTAMVETPSPFDWTALNDGGIATSIQRTSEGGAFEFSAPASIGGPLLQQVQVLPPGRYRLAGHSRGIEQDARARPYWTLTCRRDGRELSRVAILNSAEAGGMFAGTVAVPADCPVQVLTFFAQPSDAIGGLSGQLDRLTLLPMQQNSG